MHQTHFGFDHDVVASPVAVRTCLAIASDASIDQLGVDLSQGFIVHAIFLKATGEIVLD
jgi:hypothetical protein